ncbi:MAG: class I SAM-dependent RNA methyltransferase, partial [Lachnospiraceae bacterium]|nr:class I SAM-dependent RNA methyltransferase [Lachnospiraceae bacterium]
VERVLIEISSRECLVSDDLYNFILDTKIEDYVSKDDIFLVSKANQDKNSALHSSMANQKTVKKAMAERLMKVYNTDFLPENNKKFSFRVKFNKNICSLRLDTSGEGLHKRGYRVQSGLAPIEETLAASIIMLTPFKKDRLFLDPFCGSGTFCIEAAMIAHNIAPGLYRVYTSETWTNLIDRSIWEDAYKEAKCKIDISSSDIKIYGKDIDKSMIDIAINNAKRAHVEKYIDFKPSDVKDVVMPKNMKYGFLVTNPPYGERLEDEESIIPLYENLKNTYKKLDSWSMYVITSFNKAEEYLGKATKNRKIYNGMIKTYLYSYMGEKPKK